MYYNAIGTNSLEYNTENHGFMIILGWYLGLGALIQSTVNSIWLAKKLGKTSYIGGFLVFIPIKIHERILIQNYFKNH